MSVEARHRADEAAERPIVLGRARHGWLDREAITAALRRWKFRPLGHGSRTVNVRVSVPIGLALDEYAASTGRSKHEVVETLLAELLLDDEGAGE